MWMHPHQQTGRERERERAHWCKLISRCFYCAMIYICVLEKRPTAINRDLNETITTVQCTTVFTSHLFSTKRSPRFQLTHSHLLKKCFNCFSFLFHRSSPQWLSEGAFLLQPSSSRSKNRTQVAEIDAHVQLQLTRFLLFCSLSFLRCVRRWKVCIKLFTRRAPVLLHIASKCICSFSLPCNSSAIVTLKRNTKKWSEWEIVLSSSFFFSLCLSCNKEKETTKGEALHCVHTSKRSSSESKSTSVIWMTSEERERERSVSLQQLVMRMQEKDDEERQIGSGEREEERKKVRFEKTNHMK